MLTEFLKLTAGSAVVWHQHNGANVKGEITWDWVGFVIITHLIFVCSIELAALNTMWFQRNWCPVVGMQESSNNYPIIVMLFMAHGKPATKSPVLHVFQCYDINIHIFEILVANSLWMSFRWSFLFWFVVMSRKVAVALLEWERNQIYFLLWSCASQD